MNIASNTKQNIYDVIITPAAHSLKLKCSNMTKAHSSLQVTKIQTIDQQSQGMHTKKSNKYHWHGHVLRCMTVIIFPTLKIQANRLSHTYRMQKNNY